MFKYAFSRSVRVASSRSQSFNQASQAQTLTNKLFQPHLTRPFSSTRLAMTSKLSFEEAVLNRRSIYQLNKKTPQSDERIKEIIKSVITHTPSTFNSQSTRIVVLLGAEHDKFWDTTTEILKAIVPEDHWESTAGRMAGFKGAYGTALFYEDPAVTRALQEKMPTYADKFQPWAGHTSAMHQYHAWVALEAEGFGASLQHYDPLVNAKVSEIWGVPQDWTLNAQLVFGGVVEGARDKLPQKDVVPYEKRLFFHGA